VGVSRGLARVGLKEEGVASSPVLGDTHNAPLFGRTVVSCLLDQALRPMTGVKGRLQTAADGTDGTERRLISSARR